MLKQIWETRQVTQSAETTSESRIPIDQSASVRVAGLRRQRRAHRLSVWITRSVIGLLLLCSVLVAAVLLFDSFFAARVYPSITVHGVPVGAMTRAEATIALQRSYADFVQQPVTLTYRNQTWHPSLDDLGIHLEMEPAIQAALSTGRDSHQEQQLRAAAAITLHGWNIPIHLRVDEITLQHYLRTHLAPLEQPATNAQLQGDTLLPSLVPATHGRQVLVDQTMRDVLGAVQTLHPQQVVVRTRPLEPLVHDAAVIEAQQQLAMLVHRPLLLTANEQQWVWPPEKLATLVQLETRPVLGGEEYRLNVRLNRARIQRWLEPIARATRQKPIYPRVNWNGGNLSIFAEGTPGREIDRPHAAALIVDTLWTPDRSVALPFKEIPVARTPDDLAQLGIVELLSVGRTDFEGSEDYRVTNIIAGMRLLHGHLLAPGEEFSFNQTIKSIDEEHGFVKGWAIVDGETQIEWGGGICQDSTTMLRAAFWAGLPITERWNHSRYISWYDKYGYGSYGDGPGIDSTIFLGGADLRFVNDTGAWILIQAHANPENTLAEIRMYGTRGGRMVELAEPVVKWRDNGAMDVVFTRIIKEHGTEVYRRTYWSSFKPW